MTDTSERYVQKMVHRFNLYFLLAVDLDVFEFDDYRADYPRDRLWADSRNEHGKSTVASPYSYDFQQSVNLDVWAQQERAEAELLAGFIRTVLRSQVSLGY